MLRTYPSLSANFHFSLSYNNLQKSVNDIVRETAFAISQNTALQQSFFTRLDEIATSLQNQRWLEGTHKDPGFESSAESVLSRVEDKHIIDPLLTLGLLKKRIEQHYKCRALCPCTCHKKQSIKSAPLLDNLTGSFKITYSSIPILQPICSFQNCRVRRKAAIDFQYNFPKWLLRRIITFTLFISRQKGPEFLLRVIRVISSKSELFNKMRANDLEGVRQLLESGKVSIYDVDNVMGCTPLMVCSYSFED